MTTSRWPTARYEDRFEARRQAIGVGAVCSVSASLTAMLFVYGLAGLGIIFVGITMFLFVLTMFTALRGERV